MFKKILIANRGEIALRIHRACQDLSIRSAVVHSTADINSMAVRLADQAICIGPPPAVQSYLNAQTILSAAEITGADAVHPGIGFLSENAEFAQMVTDHNLVWIGPAPQVIARMGDKVEAKRTAKEIGLPLVPGFVGALESTEQAQQAAKEAGFPVLLKAASGGGGRGMRVAQSPDELPDQFQQCRAEAKAAFGDDTVYLEKYLEKPRHVEFQIIADSHGRVLILGERDCSIQRRHQKVIEEAPSSVVSSTERARISIVLEKAMQRLGYVGVGTVEFLYENGEFYFIEMNTRLQVEHPVTELIYGIDLVTEQICVAAGEKLSFGRKKGSKVSGPLIARGHAIECRINAEDPVTFLPSPGTISRYHAPGGAGIRVDSALYEGAEIPPWYDGLAAKVITWGNDREHARKRMLRALGEFVVEGIRTNISLHQDLLRDPDFVAGTYDIHWLEKRLNV